MTNLKQLAKELLEKATPGNYELERREIEDSFREWCSLHIRSLRDCEFEDYYAGVRWQKTRAPSLDVITALAQAYLEAVEAMTEIRGNCCTESGYYSCGAPCKDEARAFLEKYFPK